MPRRVNLIPVNPADEPVGSRWNPIDLTSEPEPELECDEELIVFTPPRLPRLLWRYRDYNDEDEAWVAAQLELEEARRDAALLRAQALDRRVRRRLFH